MLGRAAGRLSKDLYTSSLHAVFELLQNADDNSFESDQLPCAYFQLDPYSLLVHVNESGFTEVNVRALSNIAASTKQNSEGYIGEKGN